MSDNDGPTGHGTYGLPQPLRRAFRRAFLAGQVAERAVAMRDEAAVERDPIVRLALVAWARAGARHSRGLLTEATVELLRGATTRA